MTDSSLSLSDTIVPYPDEILTTSVESCFTEDLKELEPLIESMFEMMYDVEGVGLAANQVNLNKKVLVYDTREGPKGYMLNPIMKYQTTDVDYAIEGCLSLKDYVVKVPRFQRVKVHYRDLNWDKHTIETDGYFARILQHEHDHLHGTTIATFMNRATRRKLQKT